MKAINLLDPRGFIIVALALALLGVGPTPATHGGYTTTLTYEATAISSSHDARCLAAPTAAVPVASCFASPPTSPNGHRVVSGQPVLIGLDCYLGTNSTSGDWQEADSIALSAVWGKTNDASTGVDWSAQSETLILMVGDNDGGNPTTEAGDTYGWRGAIASPYSGTQVLAIRVDVEGTWSGINNVTCRALVAGQ